MRVRLALVSLAVLPMAVAAGSLSVPNLFSNGTVADADAINENFAAVAAAVSDNDERLGAVETVVVGGSVVLGSSPACTAGALRYDAARKLAELCLGGAAWLPLQPALGRGQAFPTTTCAALAGVDPTAGDGTYWLDPDGPGGAAPLLAWCDMTNGGWTLVMRFAPDATFEYDSAYWTNTSLLNAASYDPTSSVNSKYESFLLVPGTQIRGCKGAPGSANCISFTFGGTARSARTVFNEGAKNAGLSRATFVNLFGDDTSQPNCNVNGLNRNDAGNYARARFGHVANNETDCTTSDASWGWGLYGASGGTKCGAGRALWTGGSQCVQGSLWIR